MTLKDISAKCGCSVATVSKALNGMSDISEETTLHVRRVAAEMGYMPNAAARTLKTNRSRTIGLLMFLREDNVWTHDYFSRIAASIQDVMEENGYDITPINCNRPGVVSDHLNYCRHRGYDGVIVMSVGFEEDNLNELVKSEIPVVTIDYAFPSRGAVLSDNQQGMKELARFAYEKGHRRIAFIHGENTIVTQGRLQSFNAACDELALAVPPDYYLRSAFYHDPKSAVKATLELLALPKRPTCIFYQDDYACIGCMDLLRREGRPFPADISFAGYDGIRLAELISPRLTTFQQNSGAIGREAARMLIEAIEKPRNFEPRYVSLPGRLIEGETVRPIGAVQG